MKEVFIISSTLIINGKTAGSQRILNTARALALGNVKVYLCALPEIYKYPFECTGFASNIYNLHNNETKDDNFIQMFRFILALQKFIKERNSDSVIYLYPAGRVIFEWIYLIYFKFIKSNRLFCDINELRVTTFYNYASPEKFFPRLYNYIKFPVKYLKFKSSEFQALFYDGVIVISTNLEKYFTKYTKRMIRIPILCDLPENVSATAPIHYNNDIFRICFAGTLSNKKEGLDPLLKTIGILNQDRDVELHLYGYFPEFEESLLRKTAESYNINDKVFYHGFLEPLEVNHEFPKYHLLILPRPLNKQTKYGFSTKLAEYIISGVPTLVTNVSDNGMYIKDGFNGYLIDPGSITEMVSKIIYIIDNYNECSYDITGNAFRTARDNFDYRLYTDTLIDFLFNNALPR